MRVSKLKSLSLAGACAAAALLARADSISEKRIELLFRPLLGERMALSTDGHYLAYTQHVGSDLTIVVMDLERLETKTRIVADEDRPILHSKEKQRAQLRFLEWADGNRLVFAPTVEVIPPAAKLPNHEFLASLPPEAREAAMRIPPPEAVIIAPVMAVDADGTYPRELVSAKQFSVVIALTGSVRMRVPRIHDFAPGAHREHLLIEVPAVGNDAPTELYRLNVHTGVLSLMHRESGPGRFIYDWGGQPRMSQQFERDGSSTFLYHAADSTRWGKMPEPAGADAGAHFTVSPGTYFGERAMPLGFDFDPNVLIYASNAGRDTFGIYGMNLKTRQRTTLALEYPHRDLAALDASMASSSLVFDKFRQLFAGVRTQGPRPLMVWLDADLAEVQRTIEEKFPQRRIHVLEWNEARTRFLVQVTGGAEPGRTYLFQRPEGVMVELMRSAPWLPNAELHETRFIEFAGPDGAPLTGYLTLPRTPRLNPPPLIIWFAPGLPPQPHREFDPQAQVLADMGFVVCRLNNRGVLGLGAQHRDALRRDLDRAPAADALAAIEWIAQRHRIDRKRVATLGEGFAGHLALRATQLHPETFRCAVIFDPIINLASWVQPPPDASGPPTFTQEINRLFLEGGGAKLHQLSVTAHADDLNAPVFIATRTEQRNAADATVASGVAQLRAQLKRRNIPCVTVDTNDDFTQGLPGARARVYRALEKFFNLNLYDYNVRIGPTRVVR